MRDIGLIVLGAAVALVGTVVTTYLQVLFARRIRMDEIVAERKVDANAAAYEEMKQIQLLLMRPHSDDWKLFGQQIDLLLERFEEAQIWFFSNRLFLPGKFPDHWLGIRAGLPKIRQAVSSGEYDVAEEDAKQLRAEATAGIMVIYKEMRLKQISVGSIRSEHI